MIQLDSLNNAVANWDQTAKQSNQEEKQEENVGASSSICSKSRLAVPYQTILQYKTWNEIECGVSISHALVYLLHIEQDDQQDDPDQWDQWAIERTQPTHSQQQSRFIDN